MKFTSETLHPGVVYHIYNRGNNGENLFIETRNYSYFLALYAKHIQPVADTYAYCLMRNHFHLLARIKTEAEFLTQSSPVQTSQVLETCEVLKASGGKKYTPSRSFANLFNAYAKAINKAYNRTGSLFEERFGRIPVTQERYFAALIFYIHYNPQKHGFVEDFRQWQWSSYHALAGVGQTRLRREEVLEMFSGRDEFERFHRHRLDEKRVAELVDAEFEAANEDLTGLGDL